jgi:hypothetical protein
MENGRARIVLEMEEFPEKRSFPILFGRRERPLLLRREG